MDTVLSPTISRDGTCDALGHEGDPHQALARPPLPQGEDAGEGPVVQLSSDRRGNRTLSFLIHLGKELAPIQSRK
jgi:hypothetical protein